MACKLLIENFQNNFRDYKMKNGSLLSLFGVVALSVCTSASAVPTVTVGETISNPDVSLNFEAMTLGQNLSNYHENGIAVTVSDTAYLGFNAFVGYDNRAAGFHYASGGNTDYVTIKGLNNEIFAGVGFLLGNGYQINNNFVTYATYLNGTLSGEGRVQAPNGLIKFVDFNGFDELRVNADSFSYKTLGEFQAIAIDDLNLDIKDTVSDVPEPGSLALLGLGVIGLMSTRRRKVA